MVPEEMSLARQNYIKFVRQKERADELEKELRITRVLLKRALRQSRKPDQVQLQVGPQYALEGFEIYDERELLPDCTVEILRNSVTGQESFGWWRNDNPPAILKGSDENDG